MFYVMLFIIFVPIVVISLCIPFVTRRTESFGVSIPEDIYHSDKLRVMRKSYARITGIFGVSVMVVILILSILINIDEMWWDTVFSIALTLVLICSFVIYLKFHSRMKVLKANSEWQQTRVESIVIDTSFRNRKLGINNIWFLMPILITLVTLVMTFVLYDQIPASFPTRYDFNGHAKDWVDKSYRTVMMLPIVQLYLTGLFIFVNSIILRSKQQIDSANPQKSIQQNIKFRRRWSGFSLITGTAMVLMFFLMQLSLIITIDPRWLMIMTLVVTGGIIIGTIVLAFSTGQGGSRVKTEAGQQGNAINHNDDQYWKLGVLYVNRNDPSIWVEKRFGIGWTVNFAHPLGWGILVIIILIVLLLKWLE